LVQFFGGKIIRAERLMHGKTSKVEHDQATIYQNIPDPFTAGRYHSLSAEPKSMPDVLSISATTKNKEIMGVRHISLPIEGVQFHPESILTPDGPTLLRNFLRMGK
jgi:anthranilate synthase/aminodeoxychorismate synthase-like glutamine amidotransferase